MKQHYKTLGIEEGSSQDVINEAYFCLRKKLQNQTKFYGLLANVKILFTKKIYRKTLIVVLSVELIIS